MDKNSELVQQLKEAVNHHDSGLTTDYELLANALNISVQMESPQEGSIDQNTGLRMPYTDEEKERQAKEENTRKIQEGRDKQARE